MEEFRPSPRGARAAGRDTRVSARPPTSDKHLQGQPARLRGWAVRAAVTEEIRAAPILPSDRRGGRVGSFNRADGPEDRAWGAMYVGPLPDFGGAAGYFLQVVQSPGTVSIFYDTGQGQGWQRIIPVTEASAPTGTRAAVVGDSRGRWEGETLVVDVTNFSPKTDYQGSRENLHLVERWTRLDAETIEYVATMEDPTTWTRPWTVAVELSRQSNEANRSIRSPGVTKGTTVCRGRSGARVPRNWRSPKVGAPTRPHYAAPDVEDLPQDSPIPGQRRIATEIAYRQGLQLACGKVGYMEIMSPITRPAVV